jgi:hypothetical protein
LRTQRGPSPRTRESPSCSEIKPNVSFLSTQPAVATTEERRDRINSQRRYESEAQNAVNQKEDTMTTHRVHEHELLQRLERFCEAAGLEFPKEAWPKDDHKAYFLLGVCATEDMKGLTLRERLERLDDWARQRNLLKPNETLFAKMHRIRGSGCFNNVRRRQQSLLATGVKS